MTECAAVSSCVKLPMTTRVKATCFLPQNLYMRTEKRKVCGGHCKVVQTWTSHKLSDFQRSSLDMIHVHRQHSWRCNFLGSVVNAEGMEAFDWVPLVDQVLLTASIFLTYMAGVTPSVKSNFTTQNTLSDNIFVPESSCASGSASKNDDQVDSKYAWDVIRKKLLDSLNAIKHVNYSENTGLESEQLCAKRPLSLNAVAEGPRLQLLWASFWFLRKEVKSVKDYSKTINMDEWLRVFYNVIQNSYLSGCVAWLEEELCPDGSNLDKELVSLMSEKLNGDVTLSEKIRKSGKEDLYAELLFFLRFGSVREEFCYNNRLFMLHGISILEDLVITIADGIASIYLELISVDGNLSNKINSQGLDVCALSTRALQKLRNEVALNEWLHQNIEAVVSMYEDRFDLCILQNQLIETSRKHQKENIAWWKKISLKTSGVVSSSLSYVVISQFSMSVKRTKELRALKGWRYYFSLFLELFDITMPFVRSVIEKVSNAVSFFLVYLIGRSLGLIYTGIRQSLRWK